MQVVLLTACILFSFSFSFISSALLLPRSLPTHPGLPAKQPNICCWRAPVRVADAHQHGPSVPLPSLSPQCHSLPVHSASQPNPITLPTLHTPAVLFDSLWQRSLACIASSFSPRRPLDYPYPHFYGWPEVYGLTISPIPLLQTNRGFDTVKQYYDTVMASPTHFPSDDVPETSPLTSSMSTTGRRERLTVSLGWVSLAMG